MGCSVGGLPATKPGATSRRRGSYHRELCRRMILAHVFIAVGYTWIYVRGKEAKPWLGQGVRFGLAVAVLSTIPTYLAWCSGSWSPASIVEV